MSLSFLWGSLAGVAVTAVIALFAGRAALARLRLEEGGRLSAAEALAQREAAHRERLEAELSASREEGSRLAQSLAVARAQADRAQQEIADQKQFLEHSRRELENTFKALAASVLEGSNRQFLGLAEERLNRSRAEAEADLERRKQAIESLLEPLRETLVKLESRTQEIEKARENAYTKIDEHIRLLMQQTTQLQERTTSLDTALRGSQVRGRWGELALRNIADLAGMTEHCDFLEQETLADGRRPDMVVRLPGRRMIAVDAKAPLTAYLASLEETSEAKRNEALDRHVSDIRSHLKVLAGRDYAENLGGHIDLVVMFLPGDPYLGAAFMRDPNLQNEALRAKILIATPTTLVALLRTVAIYWQQRSMAENAERIAETARLLYERTAIFSEHLGRMGKGIRGAVEAYNQAVASFERRLLPMGRQLEDMKVTEQSTRQIELLESIEEEPREVSP